MTKCSVCKQEIDMGLWLEVYKEKPILFCNKNCMKIFVKRLNSEVRGVLERKFGNGEISERDYKEQIDKYNKLKND